MEPRFSLLIDAENISPKYIKPILTEMSKYGKVTYKRIYGDWTNTSRAGWKNNILENSITPVQQFRYVEGKNASDAAMIIDAMDMLYTGQVEGFCLVSSDSDFTKLAERLREGGMMVIGMGEAKTPQALRSACDIFTVLETLMGDDEEEAENHNDTRNGDITIIGKKKIESDIIQIISENQNNNKKTGLAEVGNRLVKLYPDFDVRRYGYSLLSKFLETMPKLHLSTKNNNHVFVEIRENEDEKHKVRQFVKNYVKQAPKKGVSLGTLGRDLREEFKGFKVKDYGYTQFYNFVESIDDIEVIRLNEQMFARWKERG